MREVLAADHRPPRSRAARRRRWTRRPRPSPARSARRAAWRTPAPDTGPSTCTSDSDDTAYHRSSPGRARSCRRTAGAGTASTSRPAWSSGCQGPSADVGDVHLVADRARHRRPGQRHLGTAGDGDQAAGRPELGCGAAEGVAAADPDPVLPVGACVGRHRSPQSGDRVRSAAVALLSRGREDLLLHQRPQLLLHRAAGRRSARMSSPASALPSAAITMPWSSDR